MSAIEVVIVFASTTGVSEDAARTFNTEITKAGFTTRLEDAGDVDPYEVVSSNQLIVFFTSTYGEGEFPATGQELYKYLCNNAQPGELTHLKFAVFGIGSSNFPNFCRAGIDLESVLTSLGANRIADLQTVDTSKPGVIDECLENFTEEMLSVLPSYAGEPSPPEPQPPIPRFRVVQSLGSMSQQADMPTIPGTKRVKLKSITLKTANDYFRPVFHVVFENNGFKYNIGDSITLKPWNDPQLVDKLIHKFGLNADDLVTIVSSDGKRKFPPRITWRQVFTEWLAIESVPQRKLCNDLSWYCQGDEKEKLLRWGSKDGTEELSAYIKEGGRVADLLLELSTLSMDPSMMVSLIPGQKSRLYSVASSPNVYPNEIHMVMVLVSYKTPNGKIRQGVTSGYISRLYEQYSVTPSFLHYASIGMNPGTLKFVDDIEAPIICFALGTGIAPFLAIFQERNRLIQQGKKIGNALVYIGCRHHDKDFLFKDQIEGYLQNGTITHLKTAFSHDQEQFITPLTKLEEDKETPVQYIKSPIFVFYYCGPGFGIPGKIEGVFAEIARANNIDPKNVVARAKKEFRWNVEAF
ncbi:hypothetical protein P9112_003100 [Eukaryota sp. TZLM1-RC]